MTIITKDGSLAEVEGAGNGQEVKADFWADDEYCLLDKRCAECLAALHCKPLFYHSKTLARQRAFPLYEMLPAPKPSLLDRLIDFIKFVWRLLR